MANGFYHVKDTEQFVDSWASDFGKKSSRIQELADGRSMNVCYQRTANGGHVVTHQDVTERQKLNARLEQQHQLLKQQEERLRLQNLQLDAALNNMVQGLAMFDAELRVVIANDRYAQIYGLGAEQVKPGTPLQKILEYRVANGSCCGHSADEMLQAMLRRTAEQESSHYSTTLADGRHIAVSLNRMADGGIVSTHQDISDQRRSEAKIVHMALHDALTDLPNRVLLNERLEHALARVRRGEMVAVHLLDLDHFKTVNDTHGHAIGDAMILAFVRTCRLNLREGDILGRLGGDEFAVLLPETTVEQAEKTAGRVRQAFAREGIRVGETRIDVSVSVGVAALDSADRATLDALLRGADTALYEAERAGRNRVVLA
jgi:diguanylate cyclase (GGDEF)-like protein